MNNNEPKIVETINTPNIENVLNKYIISPKEKEKGKSTKSLVCSGDLGDLLDTAKRVGGFNSQRELVDTALASFIRKLKEDHSESFDKAPIEDSKEVTIENSEESPKKESKEKSSWTASFD